MIRALVKRKRRVRPGRGFSRAELREAGLSVKEALKLGIPVDVRRSTRHEENIEALRSFLVRGPWAKKPKEAEASDQMRGIPMSRAGEPASKSASKRIIT